MKTKNNNEKVDLARFFKQQNETESDTTLKRES